MKYIYVHILIFLFTKCFSQIDTLKVNSNYWEDQLYININYNILLSPSKSIKKNEFSYGISAGYIKDIPLNKKRTIAIGLGLGYLYDNLNNNFVIEYNYFLESCGICYFKKITSHNLEFPIQIRFRNSDAITYYFWRAYIGSKISYNLNNNFIYSSNGINYKSKNVLFYNKFQAGIELSIGYGIFNFYGYYGLTPIFNNTVNFEKTNIKLLKFGLIFYLL